MDQLKTQLALAIKYGFWISCGLVVLVSVAIWYLTTSKLTDQNKSQTSKINSAIQTVSSVEQELDGLPNDHSHVEMEKLIEARQEEVLTSWKRLYDRQRGILTWPVNELKADFVDEFKDLIPIERYVEFPTDPSKEKETTLRSRYQRYIKNSLPMIAEIAGAEWTAEFDSAMSMDAMMGMMTGGPRRSTVNVDISGAEKGPLVKWGSDSQQNVLKDLFPWRGQLPTTLDVYYSQENIWVLKQLLQIIADVNGDARQPYQAKIREIRKIGIGKSVKFGEGHITKPGEGSRGMMGMMGMDMAGMMMDMGSEMEMAMGSDMAGEGAVDLVDPAENRYVNAALKPISGSALRSALTSNSPSDSALAVAKRVPVMMTLNMDQRAVHELIAKCGSADLMVEINQVRLLPKMSGGGGMGMMGGDDSSMDMEMSMSMGMGMGMGMGSAMPAPTQPVDEFPLDMSVEIYGIIYIYNPPDRIKLGLEQVTEDTVLDGATETIGGERVIPADEPGELPTPQLAVPQTPEATTPTPDATTPDASAPDTSSPDTTAPAPGDTTTEAVPPVALIGN